MPLRQIIIITGIRRCKKSTLLKQAINYLIESGVDAKNILFINLEHPYFLDFRDNPNFLNKIYDGYLKLINPKGKVYCFLDEIQYFHNWQVYIKNRYETTDIKFIITGSNSSMLSHKLNALLSGRSLNIYLSTFNFREFLNYKGIEYKDQIARVANRIAIARAKDEFLKWGGFYKVFDSNDESIKKDSLRGSLNLGVMLENSVFNLLNENYKEFTYCKDKYEINFCFDNTLVQVSYDISNQKT